MPVTNLLTPHPGTPATTPTNLRANRLRPSSSKEPPQHRVAEEPGPQPPEHLTCTGYTHRLDSF